MNNTNTTKMNNKGFSLVELIIVIAIMAVLVGVLAPQYLRYVERSRQSADVANVNELVTAVEVFSADPAHAIVSGSITCTNGVIAGDAATTPALQDAGLADATSGNISATMRSTAFQNWTITFATTGTTFTGANGAALQAALGR